MRWKKFCRRAAALTLGLLAAESLVSPALAWQGGRGGWGPPPAPPKEQTGTAIAAAGETAVTLPEERVETGGKGANAPSDGGWAGASDRELLAYLRELAALEHYQSDRAARYLNYYGSKKYTDEQILRIVNTDNDLAPYQDVTDTDVERGALMLVNKYHTLGKYAPGQLTALGSYGSWGSMESEARAAFVLLVNAAAKDGYRIWGVSPYREYNRQAAIYSSYVYRNGRTAADTYSARPGFSEHQTGLAVDVAVRGRGYGSFGGTPEFEWMCEHAHEYGFILRYGKGMDYITGYMYEPWHYRYVGVEAATYIREHGLTFEEYYYYYVIGDETP